MPTYEYKCTECEERFEIEQSIHDDALTSLPGDDHDHRLKKVFGPIGIAFKGTGFYKNDARGKSSSTVSTAATSTSTSSSDASTTSSTSTSTASDSGSTSTPKTPAPAKAATSSSAD